MNKTIKRYQSGSVRYKSSTNGTAVIELCVSRCGPRGGWEGLKIEIDLNRSDIWCVYNMLKAFADKERQQVGELPL